MKFLCYYISIPLKIIMIDPLDASDLKQEQKQKEYPQYDHKLYRKLLERIKIHDENKKQEEFKISNPNIIRGGLIGVLVTALIRWNMGKYNRLGIFRKRWSLVRRIIMTNRKPSVPLVFTNYYTPKLDTAAKNFMCYSGQAGIGKSTHFTNVAYTQSGNRPAMYLSFKFTGKDAATFEQDIAEQAQYGDNCPGILTEIIRAIKKIHQINKYPQRFWAKVLATHVLFATGIYGVTMSSLDATYGMFLSVGITTSYALYVNFIYPMIIQSLRRTCPVLIFDDLNKVEQLNMFPQIVRYLQVLQSGMANVILISPDEDTWCRLRREPGVKDRLRVRQIYYNHKYTAESVIKFISDDKNFETYMKSINGNKLYNKNIVISLVKQLIGKRQVTLRRFTSILILNDEQEYEKLVEVLRESVEGKLSTGEATQKLTDSNILGLFLVLYESQAKTMVANLKNIKRQAKLKDEELLGELKMLLKKRKLPSDNRLAPHLKAYNIVRDLQSEYVFNGRFMFTVFNIAIQQFEKDLKNYTSPISQESAFGSAPLSPETKAQPSAPARKQEKIKNWNSSNVVPGAGTGTGTVTGSETEGRARAGTRVNVGQVGPVDGIER